VEVACAQLDLSSTAVNGIDEATEAIEALRPDVVLLDVEQEGDQGFASFQRLRDRWPRLCTILIAERARSDRAIEAMKRGAIDYVLKPFHHDDLLGHITNAPAD